MAQAVNILECSWERYWTPNHSYMTWIVSVLCFEILLCHFVCFKRVNIILTMANFSIDRSSKVISDCFTESFAVLIHYAHQFIHCENVLSSPQSSCHLKLVIPIPLHCLQWSFSFFLGAHPFRIACLQTFTLKCVADEVKIGLQTNPSWLLVSFGHGENSDVVLQCWRGWGRTEQWDGGGGGYMES